jgi:hypothetical protein
LLGKNRNIKKKKTTKQKAKGGCDPGIFIWLRFDHLIKLFLNVRSKKILPINKSVFIQDNKE